MYQEIKSVIKKEGLWCLVILPIILGVGVMNMVLPLIMDFLAKLIFPPTADLISPAMVVNFAGSLILSLILVLVVNKLKLKDLGLAKENALNQSVTGAIFGFLAISLVSLLINVFGGVTTSVTFKSEYLGFIFLAFVMFIFQSTFEEFVYRAYLLPNFAKKFGDGWAILGTSVLFVILHAANSGMGVIPVINLFLAGVVFALVYYNWGSLWLCGLSHALWNFSQGVIYGSLVSGNPLSKSVMKAIPVEGMNIISGADFGFEGSIISSIVGVIIAVLLVMYANKKGNSIKFTK